MLNLTLDKRKETLERIKQIETIKLNLIDAKAELEEVKKRNPLVRTKSKSESTASGNGDMYHVAIHFMMKEKELELLIMKYHCIVNDYNRGYRLLTDSEKEVLELRYHKNYSQQMTADTMKYSLARIQQLEASLIGKMVNAMFFTKL